MHSLSILTSIDQRHSVIDRLLCVGLEDLRHVWEWRLPFESVAEIAMRAHSAKEATRRSNCWVQRLANLVRQESRRRNRRIMTCGNNLKMRQLIELILE